MRKLALLAALAAASISAATTRIVDTVKYANGTNASGTVRIEWPSFTSGSTPVAAGFVQVNITSGVLDVSLQPTDVATPSGTVYTVRFYLQNAPVSTEYWSVPTGSGAVTLPEVRQMPLTALSGLHVLDIANDWKQVSTPGTNPSSGYLSVYAKTGSGICWKSSAGVETCAGAGSGDGTWGSITGTLSDQTDLNSALAGKLAAASNLSDVASASTARTNLGLGGAATLNVGTSAGTVAAGDDSRLSDARTPTFHASTHQNGGADEVATATPGANAIPKAGGGGTLAAGWIPTLNQNTTGTAAALAVDGADCSSGQAPLGVDASGAVQGCYDVATQAELDAHTSDTANPHSVTATQVGLGSVDNYATASQGEAEAGTATDRFMTPERTAQAIAALQTLYTAGYLIDVVGTQISVVPEVMRVTVQATPPSGPCTPGTDDVLDSVTGLRYYCSSSGTWQEYLALGLTQTVLNKTFTTPKISAYTVGTLPGSPGAGALAVVTDGLTAGDCIIGGGAALSFCRYSGSAWVALGDGGTSTPNVSDIVVSGTQVSITHNYGLANPLAFTATCIDEDDDTLVLPLNYTGSDADTSVANFSGTVTNVRCTFNYNDGVSGSTTFSGDAGDVPFTPAGSIAATDVQAAIQELDTEKQPLDAALTALAAGSDFVQFSGPSTSTKTFTLPNATATILTSNSAVTVAQGGTGIASGTSGGVPYFSGSTSIASSAALAANQLVLGGGAGASPATLGSLGTTTTVLHGNAAGAPTFGAVSLTADVSGTLPAGNGGTGNAFFAVSGPATSTKTFTFPNNSATVLTTDAAVTVAQGGTGATTLTGPLKGNGTSAFSAAAASDIYGLWSGTCTASTYLRGDGSCATPSGSGDVTAASSFANDNRVIRSDGTGKGVQASGVTLDDSDNMTVPGTLTAGGFATSSGSTAGFLGLVQGTASTAGTTEILLQAPTSVTSYQITLPGATGTGFWLGTDSSGTETITRVGSTGSGNVARATSPAFTTPDIGVATATSVNKVAITAPATSATLTIANGKTLTASNTITFTGTDSSSVALGTGGTVSYTIASGTSALGTSGISSGACATVVTTSATGTATTDVITWGFNTDPTAITGYASSASGGLFIYAYPSTNNVNFKVCNDTAGSITPGAMTLNWRVVR